MEDTAAMLYTKYKEDRLPPLFKAVLERSLFNTNLLLSQSDVNVNEVFCQTTVLNIALINDYVEIVERLLRHPGIKLNRQPNCVWTPLHSALQSENVRLFSLLLDHEISDINETDIFGRSCFMLACFLGKISAIECLLDSRYKNNINHCIKCEGYTASHYACMSGYTSVVQCLLTNDMFLPNVTDNFGQRPLDRACEKGQINVVRLLLNRKHFNTISIFTFIQICTSGHVELIKLLLEHKRYPSLSPSMLLNSIKCAIFANYTKVACVLIDVLIDMSNSYLVDDVLSSVTSTLQNNIWHPHKELSSKLQSLWCKLHRMAIEENARKLMQRKHSKHLKIGNLPCFDELFDAASEESGIKPKCDSKLYMLYYLIL